MVYQGDMDPSYREKPKPEADTQVSAGWKSVHVCAGKLGHSTRQNHPESDAAHATSKRQGGREGEAVP